MAVEDIVRAVFLMSVEEWNNYRKELRAAEKSLDLSGVDLGNRSHQAADFSEADLTNAILESTNFQGSNFSGANLQGAQLSSANLNNTNFNNAILRGAEMKSAHVGNASFSSANLEGVNFQNAQCDGSNFTGAIIRAANLFQVSLSQAKFTGADLSEAQIINSQLAKSCLRDAHLCGSNLDKSKFSDAILTGANFSGAIITKDTVGLENMTADQRGSVVINNPGVRRAGADPSNSDSEIFETAEDPKWPDIDTPMDRHNRQVTVLDAMEFVVPANQVLEGLQRPNDISTEDRDLFDDLVRSVSDLSAQIEALDQSNRTLLVENAGLRGHIESADKIWQRAWERFVLKAAESLGAAVVSGGAFTAGFVAGSLSSFFFTSPTGSVAV